MKGRTFREHLMQRFVMGLVAVAGFGMAAQPVFPGDAEQSASGHTIPASGPTAGQQPGEKAPAVPGGAAGMTIHIDPHTGAILKEPAPGTVPLQMTRSITHSLSTSDQDLVEIPSSVPGGGFRIDLQGRFRSPLVATIDANGTVKIQHLHGMPDSQ